VDAWVQTRPEVRWTRPSGGLTGFLELGQAGRSLDGDEVARRLQAECGLRIVPGSFFQAPAGLRLSYMLDPLELERGLEALGSILDTLP